MDWIKRTKNMEEYTRILLGNTAASFLIRGVSLVLSLLATPAFVEYFRDQRVLGVWYTMLSVLFWVLNFDLGIGNGIRNQLVQDFSSGDIRSARKTISSGFFSGGLLVLTLGTAGMLLIRTVDLNWLFNVDTGVISYEVLVKSALLVFCGIMARFFLTYISAVFYALQLSSLNSFLGLCASALQLLFVTSYSPEDPETGLWMLSGTYAVVSNLPLCVAGVVVFAARLRDCRPSVRYVDPQTIRRIMGTGTVFFICQIASMLLLNTNELFISRLFGPEDTAEYTFYYKITSLISIAAALVLTPMWSVVTKAMAERRYDWLRKLYGKLKIAGALGMAAQFAFVLVQQTAMDFWLGKGSVQVEYPVAMAFACFGSVFLYTSILSTLVCGMSRMGIQMVCYCAGVFGKIACIVLLAPAVQHWSVVVWSNVFALLPYCVIQQIDLDRFFGKNMDFG